TLQQCPSGSTRCPRESISTSSLCRRNAEPFKYLSPATADANTATSGLRCQYASDTKQLSITTTEQQYKPT
ncbi:hypothetical protein RF183_12750, partial [Escherichia coli]|uniref:hypothetical protein n=1 Tax=Escherichia coli TaxID=562 RepID=UPI002812D9EA